MLDRFLGEIRKAVVGYDDVAIRLLIALITENNVLLEGPPGIAKTLLAKAFARTTNLSFKRIQFVPDLLPSDITGYFVYRNGKFEFIEGPIFANIILADEINRAPPKTQAALLEAMQEKQITVEGKTFELPRPFMVIATQNPIEEEGVYPLPAAQLDRFLFKINMDYPKEYESIIGLHLYGRDNERLNSIGIVFSKDNVKELATSIKNVKVSELIVKYLVDLVKYINNHKAVKFGLSPRAVIQLIDAARAYALLNGRNYVISDDVKYLIPDTFNHRIYLKEEYAFRGISSFDIINEALHRIKAPEERIISK